MKIKYFILYLILFGFFVFSNCKKIKEEWHETSVHGQVTDANTGNPIEGAIVQVGEYNPDEAKSFKNIWFTITANDGHYEYRFHAKNKMYYSISGYKVVDCYYFGSSELKLGKVNEKNMSSGSSAQLKFHVKNISSFDNNDNICLYGTGWTGSIGCLEGSNVDYTSPDNGNYIYCGNTKIQIRWEVTKNNIITTYSDSLFIKPCIVNDFYINY